jgi:murein L,D-transpeptidase YafK
MIENRMFSRGTAVKSGPFGKYRVPTHRRSLRIRFKTLLVSAAILIPIAIAVYVFLNPAPAPTALLDEARWALEGASKVKAVRYAEKTYRKAEELTQAGWMELARQNGRLAPFRDYRVADSLLRLAYQTSEQASHMTGDYISNVTTLARMERREIGNELVSWAEAMNGSLAKLNVKKYYSSAEMAVATSDQLMIAGEYDEAREQLHLAQVWLQRLGKEIALYNSDESSQLRTWRRWVDETVADSRASGSYAVIVVKSTHKTYLVKGGSVIKSYSSELGYNAAHQKMFAGDGATPEGKYTVTLARRRGSRYYKALLLNYPNDSDELRFQSNKAKRVISARARIGGLIEIHGEGGRGLDWTEGCVALSNKDMDHLMQYVGIGTPVTIVRKSDRWP